MKTEYSHTPVLLAEVLQYLKCQQGSKIVDCTLGGAGHAEAILDLITPEGFLLGIDADITAINAAYKRLTRFSQQFSLVRSNFSEIDMILADHGLEKVDGFLFDLGLSSAQVDDADRGFSYRQDSQLDMRIDKTSPKTAEEIVNTYSKVDLSKVIRSYGGERWASRVAGFIVKRREKQPIKTSGQLVDIIKEAIPASARRRGGHPAKRTFQALRIEVNDELNRLKKALAHVPGRLLRGGRVVVISYHSLEDKIVKDWMRELARGCICPPELPVCRCGNEPLLKIITRSSPVTPSEAEIERNPRSRSAKLRAAEKI